MDEQALEAQGVAALCVKRKCSRRSRFDRREMGIDDPTAPPPPSASTLGSSTGGGGIPSA